ncbi:hypothetical protein Pint_35193 [Pistacia integerrima]|uniref:Uncharacterized protein n=1 Tax=Pistacia integerrima TaxID=434235 RepID=A0ACC0Y2C4_9ROSI|nr:hypothetical protein Pint_35193 [Pistacia integerrima]
MYLEAADVEPGSSSSSLVNQQVQKRAYFPRSPQFIPSKRSKEELHGSDGLSSSRQQKNGHPVEKQ